VGVCPPFTQELQFSSGSHFWSLPELSFRDACAQPCTWQILSLSCWLDLEPKSSLQTCLAITGPWLFTVMGPALFSWLGHHGTVPWQRGDFPHLPCLSPSALDLSSCGAATLVGPWLPAVGIRTQETQQVHHSTAYNADAELNYQAQGMTSETFRLIFKCTKDLALWQGEHFPKCLKILESDFFKIKIFVLYMLSTPFPLRKLRNHWNCMSLTDHRYSHSTLGCPFCTDLFFSISNA